MTTRLIVGENIAVAARQREIKTVEFRIDDLASFKPATEVWYARPDTMTTYRFRVKLEWEPRSLWRDIMIGGERTLGEFQTVLNTAMGLDQGHLWFFGTGQDYWRSSVKYQRPEEYNDLSGGNPMGWDEEIHNAGTTTIDEMIADLDLKVRDRICYLFNYGDEWRFYAILKEQHTDELGDTHPTVVNEKGAPVRQYAPPGAGRYR